MIRQVIFKYGTAEEFTLQEVPTPTISSDDILVKGHYTSISPLDYKIRQGALKYLMPSRFPRTLGREYAGEVIKVGSGISDFKPGDRVFGKTLREGCYASHAIFKSNELLPIPDSVSYQDAACLSCSGLSAYHGLFTYGSLKKGQNVLIIGGSGGLGHIAVQLALRAGAKVTASCSTKNVNKVQQLGAERVVDYKKENYQDLTDTFNVIFDTVSALTKKDRKKLLAKKGVYINTLPSLQLLIRQFLFNPFSAQKHKFLTNPFQLHPLEQLAEQVNANNLKIWIDSEFELSEIQKAHEKIETGRTVGKIIINLQSAE